MIYYIYKIYFQFKLSKKFLAIYPIPYKKGKYTILQRIAHSLIQTCILSTYNIYSYYKMQIGGREIKKVCHARNIFSTCQYLFSSDI